MVATFSSHSIGRGHVLGLQCIKKNLYQKYKSNICQNYNYILIYVIYRTKASRKHSGKNLGQLKLVLAEYMSLHVNNNHAIKTFYMCREGFP